MINVPFTVYVNTSGFCYIVNVLNGSLKYEWGEQGVTIDVSLKKTRKYPYEVGVPIQTIGQFIKKNMTTINLYNLQKLNNQNKSVPII